ncbi:hypothetical protein J6TS7_29650 [Paenibacillus dendritiformis]|uniref:DNA-binding protein n=1 Tax=Paenibacillus TaxID=44249 RepID=UPI001B01BEBF|nr:DNA-binding protein [Paenibacillus dendritiformis]GIO79355.1 hypothetical protein J6TS7_29650 [Paenibacillus dendritiformis]
MERQDPPQAYSLLEETQNIKLVFEVGERLFAEGRLEESLSYYECVVQNEANDSLTNYYYALSVYRIFRLKNSLDARENLRAAIQFEPVINKLPEHYQLDAILKILRIYFSLHMWDDVGRFSDKLHNIASRIYHEQQQKRAQKLKVEFFAELPLVFYYGFSYLAKSTALQKQGNYGAAKEYLAKYAELGWFNDLDVAGEEEVERFRLYAKANSYTLDLLSGKTEVLPEYVKFLGENPEEILPGMVTVMESANRHNMSVDDVLAKFENQIHEFKDYEDHINKTHNFTFLYQLAIYHINKSNHQNALTTALQALELSNTLNNDTDFKKCVAIVENLRDVASTSQLEQYKKILNGVIENEKSLDLVGFSVRTF